MITYKTPLALVAGDIIARHPVDQTQGRWTVAGPAVLCGETAEIPYRTPTGTAWLLAGLRQDLTLITTRRQDVIAGLRELCDFLEANPLVPVGQEQEVVYFASRGRAVADAVREVDRVAGLLGVPSGQRSTSHVARRMFHAVAYEAVAFNAYPPKEAP